MPTEAYWIEPGFAFEAAMTSAKVLNGRLALVAITTWWQPELETVPRLNSTDLLFPSAVSDERTISAWSKYKKRLGDGVPA